MSRLKKVAYDNKFNKDNFIKNLQSGFDQMKEVFETYGDGSIDGLKGDIIINCKEQYDTFKYIMHIDGESVSITNANGESVQQVIQDMKQDEEEMSKM